MNCFLNLLILSCCSLTAIAQYHSPVLSGQTGNSLQTSLVNNYKPLFLPSYSVARNNMFNLIYKENDTVECVYTGLKKYLPTTSDPTAFLYENGNNNGINTEHSYPQSKTTADAGKSDLHHIFPTRSITNSNRGSLPLGNIAPNNVDKWYFEDQTLTTAPSSTLVERCSKLDNNQVFEPREEHKGNVARAMFYYYTMYQNNANAADPNFFNTQKNTLCTWHLNDPVDSLEWLRNDRIALYQSFKKNPFILDCTLAERCGYCSQTCTPPNALQTLALGLIEWRVFPNPASEVLNISLRLNRPVLINYALVNTLGQSQESRANQLIEAGEQTLRLDLSSVQPGLYHLNIVVDNGTEKNNLSKTIIVHPSF